MIRNQVFGPSICWGHLLALHVTPASAEDLGKVERLARIVQAVTCDTVNIAYVDQDYTGEPAAKAATAHGIALEAIKLPEAKRGFVLLPRRWVVEQVSWAIPRRPAIWPTRRSDVAQTNTVRPE